MNDAQVREGRKMWQRTGQSGRLASSSFNAEANAPKTWLFYVNSKNELMHEPIECELYIIGRMSNSGEAVAMLHGMCPKCHETFIVREDNKTMSVERVSYRKAPPRFKEQWARHCREVLLRLPRDNDQIPVVSSPERWACDYCRSWCVKVHAGVCVDNHRGVTQLSVPVGTQLIDSKPDGGAIDF
jgi:hypothetical protein